MTDLEAGEKLIVDKAANMKKGLEYVGGRIAITTKRVIHAPHRINVQSDQTIIPISDIEFVTSFNQFGFLPTGIKIKTKDGLEYHFIVWGRMKLISAINDLT